VRPNGEQGVAQRRGKPPAGTQALALQERRGLNVFHLNLLGILWERIAQRLQESRETIRRYLVDLVTWPNQPNADLKKGFSVAQVADRQQWPEPLVWFIALEGKEDLKRFKVLGNVNPKLTPCDNAILTPCKFE
jgi:hypothetical protein